MFIVFNYNCPYYSRAFMRCGVSLRPLSLSSPSAGQTVKYRNRVRGLVVCEVCLSWWCSCCRLSSRYSIHLRAPHARCNGVDGHADAKQRVFRRRSLPPLLFTRWSGNLGQTALSATQHMKLAQTIPVCTSALRVGI